MFHPFGEDVKDIWSDRGRSYILYDKKKKQREEWSILLLPFTPIVLEILFVMLTIGHFIVTAPKTPTWAALVKSALWAAKMAIILPIYTTLGAIVLVAIVTVCIFLGKKINKKQFTSFSFLHKRWEARKIRRQEKQRLALSKEFEEIFAGVVFKGGPIRVSLDALPEDKQTIRLRFLDLKAKVCKPFKRY